MNRSCIDDFVFSDRTIGVSGELHRHNTYQMIYIKSGKIKLEAADSVYDCSAPCLIFLSNLEPHAITVCSDIYERYLLSLDPSKAANEIKPSELLTVFSTRRPDFRHFIDTTPAAREIETLVEILFNEYNRDNDSFSDSEQCFLSALLRRVHRLSPEMFSHCAGPVERTVAAVRAELEHDLEGRLTLGDIAAKYFISRYYLAHLFKSVTGYSVQQYRLLCRLSHARELLVGSSLSISEIAERSGFEHMSNFSRYFKAKIGISPSEYRSKMKNKTEIE